MPTNSDGTALSPELRSLAQMAKDIRSGNLNCESLMQACLSRIEQREPSVGAWVELNAEAALAAAREKDQQTERGPLHGIPIGIKDCIDTANIPTRHGSPIYHDHVPEFDATCVSKLRHAGAIILGKTVTTEFATYHPRGTANPLNLKHTPGGSSSGSAAAVADFHIPAALGTQTAASVIRPSSFCGVMGFKPSRGRYSIEGVLETSSHLDTLGFFVRSLEDVVLLDQVLSEHTEVEFEVDAPDSPVVGICRSPAWPEASSEMKECLASAESSLVAHGIAVESRELPEPFGQLGSAQQVIHACEVAQGLGAIVDANAADVTEQLQDFVSLGRSYTDTEYRSALGLQNVCASQFSDALEGVDVLLTPAAPGTAPLGLEATGNPVFSRMWTALRVPCLSFPAATAANGLPLGLQLVGRFNQDKALLQCAAKIQRAIGIKAK